VSDRKARESEPSPADAYDAGYCAGETDTRVRLRATATYVEGIEKLANAADKLDAFDIDEARAREAVLAAIARLARALG
jgi:hypothetical protein